jgi:hypothetical protein
LGLTPSSLGQERPEHFGCPGVRRFLHKLEPHLPDEMLIDVDALLHQSVDDHLGRGVQAQAVNGIPNRPILARRAHGVIVAPAAAERAVSA